MEYLILSNDKIRLKTAFGRLSHMSLSRVLTGFIKGVHSFQRNRQQGPRHWQGWVPLALMIITY